ncbi:MAG: twin-arginine translocase subunit TatC [Polyangiales bacterium]
MAKGKAVAVEGRMTLGEHLEELRVRIFRAGAAVMAGMVVGWYYREQLFAWLLRPLEIAWFCRARDFNDIRQVFRWMADPATFRAARDAASALPQRPDGFPLEPQVHFPDPTAGFIAYLKIAAIGGFVLALPVVFYQLWAFVAPGLYAREKKLVLPLVALSTVFFIAGALFGYHFVFPVGYEWFLGFGGTVAGTHVKVVPTLMMDEYLSFTSQMLLAFGVVFELPLFVFFMSLAGLVTWKQLLKFSRYFIVLAFVLAAVLTPTTDVYSQVMLALPLVVLYFVAVGLSYVFGAKEAKPWRTIAPDPDDKPAKKKVVKPQAPLDDPEAESRRAAKIRAWEEEQARNVAAKLAAKEKGKRLDEE